MKSKRLLFGIGIILLFIFGIIYLYYYRPIVDDELYNYGFSYSILSGRIPYVDFNMIIPPLFPYLLSFVLLLFGKKLIIYHIFLVIISIIIMCISYKNIGYRAISLFFLLLIYPYIGYNTFCLLLFMLLIIHKKGKYEDIIDAIIISCMFLTKHTLGLLVIPSIIYSRHKKKTISVYSISLLLFLSYLLFNHSLYNFIDYGILGMFEFGVKNGGISPLFYAEVVIIIVLIYICHKCHKKEYYYLLCFQIMSFPVFNYVHFLISFIPILYYIFIYFKNNFVGTIFFFGFSIAFFVIYSCSVYFTRYDYRFLEHYPRDSFMKGRMTYTYMDYSIDGILEQLDKYSYDDLYILGSMSYWMKLNLDLPIDRYDIINNGNMGYLGYKGYIKEIDDNCKNKKCLFLINDQEANHEFHNQVNVMILDYVRKNYIQDYSSSIYSIYKN